MSSFDVGRYTGTWYEYSNVFEVFQVGNLLIHVSLNFVTCHVSSIQHDACRRWAVAACGPPTPPGTRATRSASSTSRSAPCRWRWGEVDICNACCLLSGSTAASMARRGWWTPPSPSSWSTSTRFRVSRGELSSVQCNDMYTRV